MNRKLRVFFVITGFLLAGLTAQAQPEKPLLTNCDVVKLIKADLPDTTIVQVIQHSATAFDTSPEALSELRQRGASQAILDSIVKSAAEQPATAAQRSARPELNGLPCHEGFFYKTDSRWIELSYPFGEPKLKGSEKTLLSGGIVHGGMDVVYSGAHAQLEITEPQPVFFNHVPGDMDLARHFYQTGTRFVVVRLDQKETKRLLEIKPIGVFNAFGGLKYKKNSVYETNLTYISRNVASIQPKAALPEGEYLLVATTPGKYAANGCGYEFSIRK